MARIAAVLTMSARVGMGRLFGLVSFDSLPPRSRDEVRASFGTANNTGTTIDEYI